MASGGRVSRELVDALRAHGGLLADHLNGRAHDRPQEPGPPQIAANGPRAAGREAEYELLLEMILEGSRLHYGRPRVVRTDDRDLALLLGDELYALGLVRLAELGDLAAVSELADVISLVAGAHAASDPELADAAWLAGAVAVGWGASDAHHVAKELARTRDPRASAALREVAASASRS
jgi:hypothetical protein